MLLVRTESDWWVTMTSGQVKPTYAELLQAFNILMEYWESIPDDEKPKVDKRLKEVGC